MNIRLGSSAGRSTWTGWPIPSRRPPGKPVNSRGSLSRSVPPAWLSASGSLAAPPSLPSSTSQVEPPFFSVVRRALGSTNRNGSCRSAACPDPTSSWLGLIAGDQGSTSTRRRSRSRVWKTNVHRGNWHNAPSRLGRAGDADKLPSQLVAAGKLRDSRSRPALWGRP